DDSSVVELGRDAEQGAPGRAAPTAGRKRSRADSSSAARQRHDVLRRGADRSRAGRLAHDLARPGDREPAVDALALSGRRGVGVGSRGRADHVDSGTERLRRWISEVPRGAGCTSNADWNVMTMRTSLRMCLHAAVGAALVGLVACGRKEKEAAPVVPVEVAPAIRGSIRQIVTADAVLYPRDQANIMPKISAPVRRFLVNRGDHVKQGQLIAVLENRDLAGAATASKGQFEQAQANYRSTTAAAVPEQVTKAQADVEAARQALDAANKLLDSREQLFKEGALARKAVDEAQVAHSQAKGQFDTAQQ